MPGPLYTPPELPWWLDPAKASVTDSLPVTLARKTAGALGAGGDPATAAMGMAGGPLEDVASVPQGLVSTLLRKYRTQPQGEATGALMNLLNGFKGEAPNLAQTLAGSAIGGQVPQPSRFSSLLSNATTRVPEAAGQLETGAPHSIVKRPYGMRAQFDREAAVRGTGPEGEDLFNLRKAMGEYERPSITSLDQLSDIVQSPGGPSAPPPQSIAQFRGGNSTSNLSRMATTSKLTPEKVRAIRAVGTVKDAIASFPDLGPETVKGIHRRDTYGWVPDKD